MKARIVTLAATGLAMALLAQPAAARIVKSDCSITFKGKLVLELKKECQIEFIGDDGSFSCR
ncbi:hypothetical protein V5G24_21740 [Xanthobacter sp. VTT E-85241]|uniref:hypothetical protein n=1 Tax=Roseixanthobacter finlandensis TaxID=3119922 RepID=UPI00372C2821